MESINGRDASEKGRNQIEEQLKLSSHDMALCKKLAGEKSEVRSYTDWRITTLFYSALHLLRYYLRREHKCTFKDADHGIHRGYMDQYISNDICGWYNVLKKVSENARYKPYMNYGPNDLAKYLDTYDKLKRKLEEKYEKVN